MPQEAIPPRTIPAGTLVTAQSYLIDRALPNVEIVALPPKPMVIGDLHWETGPVTAKPVIEKRFKKLMRSPAVEQAPRDRWLIDLRINNPSNWAHFLNNHLPSYFAVAHFAGLDPDRGLALLPADIPGYALEAARLFGIETLLSDAIVEGEGVTFKFSPFEALRAGRRDWMNLEAPQAALDRIMATPPDQPLPKKVFLNRGKTRAISNFAEIEPVLAARGFDVVLPESLSPADQLRLFLGAEEIVAIHGAGLAPLLYCSAERGPKRFIEILPCGHMTNVYRAMAALVGCPWIGVRGRLKPEYIKPAYQFDGVYTQFSLDSFEVDPVSLERAFEMTD